MTLPGAWSGSRPPHRPALITIEASPGAAEPPMPTCVHADSSGAPPDSPRLDAHGADRLDALLRRHSRVRDTSARRDRWLRRHSTGGSRAHRRPWRCSSTSRAVPCARLRAGLRATRRSRAPGARRRGRRRRRSRRGGEDPRRLPRGARDEPPELGEAEVDAAERCTARRSSPRSRARTCAAATSSTGDDVHPAARASPAFGREAGRRRSCRLASAGGRPGRSALSAAP